MSRANARIYKEVARQMAEGERLFSCTAVRDLDKDLSWQYQELFELGKGFSDNDNVRDLWRDEHEQMWKVLMLCLAAAIEESGGLG